MTEPISPTEPLGTCEHPQHPRTPHIRNWWGYKCVDWLDSTESGVPPVTG